MIKTYAKCHGHGHTAGPADYGAKKRSGTSQATTAASLQACGLRPSLGSRGPRRMTGLAPDTNDQENVEQLELELQIMKLRSNSKVKKGEE